MKGATHWRLIWPANNQTSDWRKVPARQIRPSDGNCLLQYGRMEIVAVVKPKIKLRKEK